MNSFWVLVIGFIAGLFIEALLCGVLTHGI
jgi:hypothetical protein